MSSSCNHKKLLLRRCKEKKTFTSLVYAKVLQGKSTTGSEQIIASGLTVLSEEVTAGKQKFSMCTSTAMHVQNEMGYPELNYFWQRSPAKLVSLSQQLLNTSYLNGVKSVRSLKEMTCIRRLI